MSPSQFTNSVRAAGLWLANVGPLAIENLAAVIAEPQPMQDTRAKGWQVSPSPSPLPHIGILIRHGLAELDRNAGAYVATPKGIEHLGKLRAAGLAGVEQPENERLCHNMAD